MSIDSIESHKKFAQKHQLNFTLLADPDHSVVEAYGSWKKKRFFSKTIPGTQRNTFIISPEGNIVKEYIGVNPINHSKEVVEDLKRLIAG